MDPYSSGEELIIKTRKPYTITKQRERWTEEEHNRFLEALKLYGRAWQRIEEHIGTKTAVQIRSHAQKFFTKLEKEALAKGIPKALDIEIPPPRPKRKPSNPYPRKTGLGTPPQVAAKDGILATSVSLLHSGKCTLDLEKEPVSEKTGGDEKLENAKKEEEKEKSREAFTLFQEAPCASMSSVIENSISRPVKAVDQRKSGELVPVLKEVINHDEGNESCVTVDTKKHQKLDKHDSKHTNHTNPTSNELIFRKAHPPDETAFHGQNTDKLSQSENYGVLSTNDIQGTQIYPRHVPVHIVDGNQEMSAKKNSHLETSFQKSMLNQTGKVHEHPNQIADLAASATTAHHNSATRYQTVPTFNHAFTPIRESQEDYRSLLHVSSTLSSLIVSSLLQNPAAHAAASFAATFWPNANVEASSGDSSASGYPSVQLSSAVPSMAAIAAATVAAATAWWAAHGLLPVCAPFHSGYSCTPTFASSPPTYANQANMASSGRENTHLGDAFQEEKLDAEHSEALVEEHPLSKSAALSSSEDSDGSGDGKLNSTGLTTDDTDQAAAMVELHDSSKMKVRKQVDRSSCGSNTTSSSEIETDALEKHEKAEEIKETDVNLSCSDSLNRRSRSSISPNESWKEVSEEGRLAFQALFSREVLPQSFSPPHDDVDNKMQLNHNTSKDQKNIIVNSEAASQLDLNSGSWMTFSSQQGGTSACAILRGERNGEKGLLTMGLGNARLKAHRTGFKPYKRCSIEAKESRIGSTGSQNDEKGPKRMRLEGDAPT